MFFVTMVITVVGAFTVFNEPYILTSGGPGTSTMTLALHMYQTGVVKERHGLCLRHCHADLCDHCGAVEHPVPDYRRKGG